MEQEQPLVEPVVELLCVETGGRLRVRIASAGYLPRANCQFPKGLRAAGLRLVVPARAVRLVSPSGSRKAFYRIDGRDVRALEDVPSLEHPVFRAGTEDGLCAVCLTEPLARLVVPCGHLCLCEACAARGIGARCIICRGPCADTVHCADVE